MNKTCIIPLILVVGIAALTTSGCKRCDDPSDPDCKNYDPCLGKEPVSAEFEMWETMPHDTLFRAYDAIYMYRPLVLKARQPDLENYQWRIGLDTTLRSGNTTTVSFGAPYGQIEITLIVNSTPDVECNPADDGRDTFRQTIHVLDYASLPIWGSYRGYESGEENEWFTMTLRLDSTRIGDVAALYNLPRGCTLNWSVVVGANGFLIRTGGSENCLGADGTAYLSKNNDSLMAVYSRFDRNLADQYPPIYKRVDTLFTFIGIRQ